MNLFDLQAKIGLNDKEYTEGVEKATGRGKKLAGVLGNGLKTAAGVGSVAIGAAAAGIAKLTKDSVESYADYEQLVGGVETLFKDSALEVQGYADRAYQTAGLSANAYMETVTGFSASLLQSLGGDTEKAAEYADQAIVDMSDNANKMGTSMESIQFAYQGFAKQNYTMLDNLKLGYGGTKSEMERLVADASKLDSSIDATDMSFGNIVKSIHAVQNEMGITGTTAKEASETISGSASAMKSSWDNLLTGISDDNANMEVLIENFVGSIGTFAENILPRVQIALEGAGSLIEELFPIVIDKIPTIINDTLPTLLQSGINIIHSVLEGISSNEEEIINGILTVMDMMVNTIIEDLPEIVSMGIEIMGKLAVGLIQAIPDLVRKVPEIISSFVQTFKDSKEQIKGIGKDMLTAVGEGIKSLASDAWTWGKDVIQNFIDGIKAKWENLKTTVGQTAQSIKDYLGFSEPKKGPLSNFHTYPADMMDLFAKGVRDNEDVVTSQIAKSFNFGEQTISAGYSGSAASASGASDKATQTIDLVLSLDDKANLMGLARELLPLLKVAVKEATA